MMRSALALLFVYQSVFAGLPPTTMKGQGDSTKPTTFFFETPYHQSTRTAAVTSLIETGNSNLLVNPSFEHQTYSTGWTLDASCAQSSIAADGVKGVTCTGINTARTIAEQNVTLTADMARAFANIPFNVYIKAATNTAIVQVCALVSGVEQSCRSLPLIDNLNANGLVTYNVAPNITSSDTSVGIRLKTTATDVTAINFDSGFVGSFIGMVGIVPEPQVFSAEVSVAGAVTIESGGDWISGNAPPSSGLFTLNLNPNVISFAPTCVASIASGSASIARINSASNTQVIVFTYNTTPAGINVAFNIVCKRNPGDPKYQASTTADVYGLLPSQTEFSAYIQGTASPSPVQRETGGDFINGSLTRSGTGTYSALWSTGFFGTDSPNCVVTAYDAANMGPARILTTSSGANIVTMSNTGALANADFTIKCSRTGADYLRARSTFENVPMSQIQQIFGTATAVCSSTPCTMAEVYPSSVTVTRSGTGAYSINAPVGTCASTSYLTCSPNAAREQTIRNGSPTASTYLFNTANTAGSPQDAAFSFNCSCRKF